MSIRFYKIVLILSIKVIALLFTSPALAQFKNELVSYSSKLETIKTNNSLRVCVWPEYFSITYLNPKNYKWSGLDIDLAKAFANDLGVGLDLIHSSFVTLVDDVLSDKCDIAMFGIGIIDQRLQHLRFTDPHLSSDVLAITTKSNPKIKKWEDIDKPGNVVCVAKNTIHEPIMNEYLKFATLSTVKDFQQREKDVRSGRADVFITDFPYAKRMLDTTDWTRLVKPPHKIQMTYYGWAVAPGDDVWYAKAQDFMHNIKQDQRLIKAASKYGLESIVVID